MSIRLIVILVLAVSAVGVAGYVANKFYNAGKQEQIQKQERKYKELERKTEDAQDDALTTPDLDERLRKFSRPD